MNLNIPSTITKISSNFLDKKSIELFVKRDDLIHNIISGNKWRKLKYNFQYASEQGHKTILSFGGAYSNHLHALSYAASKLGFNSIGVVRGKEYKTLNATLNFCQKHNMKLYYLNPYSYRENKYVNKTLLNLKKEIGSFYSIPEGGCNLLGVKGCEEIMSEVDIHFDYLCCAVGTGATASGLIRSLKRNQKFMGFVPFKKVLEQSNSILQFCDSQAKEWELIPDNHFGGFGHVNSNLVKFIRQFYFDFGIKLDLVYMGKLFYNLFKLIKQDKFIKSTRILVLHSGGLQGLEGFNFKF